MTPTYTVTKNVDVPMRDGTRLRADLWLPNSRDPVAALLLRTPYDKNKSNPDLLRPQQAVEAGFAVVIQDCRGRFASEGEWSCSYDHEGADGYDTVEWIAAQDWCSGPVGMFGPSYLGILQLVTAAQKPPHLHAIAPAMAPVMSGERAETGGAIRWEHLIAWLVLLSLDWMGRRAQQGKPLAAEHVALIYAAFQNPKTLLSHRPMRDLPLFSIPDFPITYERMVGTSEALDITGADIALPTLHVGGWYDNFIRSTLGLFQEQRALADREAADTAHLLVGPWSHAAQLPQVQGQVNFGLMASAAVGGVAEAHLSFFRKYLRREAVDLPRARYFMMNAGEWRNSLQWPPAGVTSQRWYLVADQLGRGPSHDGLPDSRDGVLTLAEPAAPGYLEYRYDPHDPTPAVGGRFAAWQAVPGPVDQHALNRRADVLRFTTDALQSPMELAGPVRARLKVSSSARDTDFIVKLVDVGPDDVALPVCEGALRMRWRKGGAEPSLLVPDEPIAVDIDLGDVAWRVMSTHRLRLQVQSASYPHFDCNPNSEHDIGAHSAMVVATNRVYFGDVLASRVDLTVLPPNDVR